jgi:hypothetical protein
MDHSLFSSTGNLIDSFTDQAKVRLSCIRAAEPLPAGQTAQAMIRQ